MKENFSAAQILCEINLDILTKNVSISLQSKTRKCGTCLACTRPPCGNCRYCQDKANENKWKKGCELKRCPNHVKN